MAGGSWERYLDGGSEPLDQKHACLDAWVRDGRVRVRVHVRVRVRVHVHVRVACVRTVRVCVCVCVCVCVRVQMDLSARGGLSASHIVCWKGFVPSH